VTNAHTPKLTTQINQRGSPGIATSRFSELAFGMYLADLGIAEPGITSPLCLGNCYSQFHRTPQQTTIVPFPLTRSSI